MEKRLRLWLMAFLLVLMGQAGHRAYAQDPQTIEVGPHFGATSYVGELNMWRNLGQWKWKEFNQFSYDWGVLVRFNYDSRWSFRFDYTHAKVRACDSLAAWRPEANLNFRSAMNDFSLMTEFNFFDYYTGHMLNVISPYIFGGISFFLYDPMPFTKDDQIDMTHLQPLMTEGVYYPKYSFSIPFGIGCKVSLTKHLAATAEWRMHYTFTDYIDDVSGVYPSDNAHVITVYDFTDPSGQFHENQQRGNSQTNDWFGMVNLSLTWKFVIPNNSSCKMSSDQPCQLKVLY